jgi:hypothetical protein
MRAVNQLKSQLKRHQIKTQHVMWTFFNDHINIT